MRFVLLWCLHFKYAVLAPISLSQQLSFFSCLLFFLTVHLFWHGINGSFVGSINGYCLSLPTGYEDSNREIWPAIKSVCVLLWFGLLSLSLSFLFPLSSFIISLVFGLFRNYILFYSILSSIPFYFHFHFHFLKQLGAFQQNHIRHKSVCLYLNNNH